MSETYYIKFFLALIFTVCLILLLGAGLRYWNEKRGFGFSFAKKPADSRLQVTSAIMLDAKRRLMLVRRDDREHLVLIGGNNDLIIETNITPLQKP